MESQFVIHLDFTQALKPQPWRFHKFHQFAVKNDFIIVVVFWL